jgi:polyhydroxyalkanoate synthesis regulator phasin
MFRLLCLAAVCAISLTISAPSVRADDSTPVIDKRHDRQKDRIKDGVRDGELTKKEARDLAKGQKRVRRMKKRAAEDGEITAKERRRIHRAQKRQSGKIYRKKHNRRNRR